MPDIPARPEEITDDTTGKGTTPNDNQGELKRLRSIIAHAAVAIKDADLYLMAIASDSVGKKDLDYFNSAIDRVRSAKRILAER